MSLHEHHRVKTENNSFNADSRLLTKKWWQAFVLIVGCCAMSESVPKSRFIFMQKIKTEESLLLVSTMWWTCPNLTQNSQPLVTQPTGSLSWPPVTRARDTVSRVTLNARDKCRQQSQYQHPAHIVNFSGERSEYGSYHHCH